MFEGTDYPKALDEDRFETWLDDGRQCSINYEYMLVIWDEFESTYKPEYVENREALNGLAIYGEDIGQETVIAVYDLYSESRIAL